MRDGGKVSREGLALVLLCLGSFMIMVDNSIVNVALPVIGRDLDLAPSSLQWVLTAYALPFGGFLLLGGRLGDLLGRRRVFVAGLAVFALASLAGGLAPTPEVLVGARAVQGLGAAALSPSALALLIAIFPAGPQRHRALGMHAGMGSLG
jgi:MFS family permease